MPEKIIEILERIISAHRPNWGEKLVSGTALKTYNGIKDISIDLRKLTELSKVLIETPKLKISASDLIIAIKKYFGTPAGVGEPGTYNEFKPYLRSFCQINIDDDYAMERFSSYLANDPIIEYRTGDDRIIKRHLKRSEYDTVSNTRLANGKNGLLPYSMVKFQQGWEETETNPGAAIELFLSGKMVRNVTEDKQIQYQSKSDARYFDRNGYEPNF